MSEIINDEYRASLPAPKAKRPRTSKAKSNTAGGGEETEGRKKASLPFPMIHTFGSDVSSIIWSFASKDYRRGSTVCKGWREQLRLHIKTVSLTNDGLTSLGDIEARGWRNLTHLDASDSDLATDADVKTLAAVKFPLLSSLDFSGCQKLSSIGVRALVKSLGKRLKCYKQDTTRRHALCKEMRVTRSIIKAISVAPALQELSLTLPTKIKYDDLSCLSGIKTLAKLSLYFEGFGHVELPHSLPALAELSIRTGSWNAFNWGSLANVSYPSILTLTINDSSCDSLSSQGWGGSQLSSALLIAFMDKLKALRRVCVVRVSSKSAFMRLPAYTTATDPRAEEQLRLTVYLRGRGIVSELPQGWAKLPGEEEEEEEEFDLMAILTPR